MDLRKVDLVHLQKAMYVLSEATGIASYDFPFDRYFECRRPFEIEPVTAPLRIGAIGDYEAVTADLASLGVTPINSLEQHLRSSSLPVWYPILDGLTPRSVVFNGQPDIDVVERELGWPVFMKGERQTSRHSRRLSIIQGPEQMCEVLKEARIDPILQWQRLICRQFESLRIVEDTNSAVVPTAFEFRVFFWRGAVVGWGRYWASASYTATPHERAAAEAVATEAAARLDVPFLVVDMAQRTDGRWIVIEVNDGQESGYAGVEPLPMWTKIISREMELKPC